MRVSQVGFNSTKLTLSMHVFGTCNSAYTFWHMVDIQTDKFYIYIYSPLPGQHGPANNYISDKVPAPLLRPKYGHS